MPMPYELLKEYCICYEDKPRMGKFFKRLTCGAFCPRRREREETEEKETSSE